jgi:hypothetical protein
MIIERKMIVKACRVNRSFCVQMRMKREITWEDPIVV